MTVYQHRSVRAEPSELVDSITDTPMSLRDRAASIRWAARIMDDKNRSKELLSFAAELEARALADDTDVEQMIDEDTPTVDMKFDNVSA